MDTVMDNVMDTVIDNVMNTVTEVDDQQLENIILRIIVKIKKNRNRACYANVHNFLNRGGRSIEKKEVMDFMRILVEKGVLHNMGGDEVGKESFKIVNFISLDDEEGKQNGDGVNVSSPQKSEEKSQEMFSEISSLQAASFKSQEKETGNIENNTDSLLEMFETIDNKFYDILCKKIQSAVDTAVEAKFASVATGNGCKHSSDFNNKNSNFDFANDARVQLLKEEITLLKQRIATKENVTKVITNNFNHDRNVTTESRNEMGEKRRVINDGNGILKITVNCRSDTTNDVRDENDGFTIVNKKKTEQKATNKKHRVITVIGDSTIKDCKPYKVKHRLATNEKLYIKSFAGASVEDMTDYVRPTIRRNPDLIVLHAGTNDLRSERTANNIATDIMRLALEMKSDVNDVMVSSITFRADALNSKAEEVNFNLKAECAKYNFIYIDNSNIGNKHLNASGLHLNFKGTVTLTSNFLNSIKI